METQTTDVLVVGAGIAGLAAALEADSEGADVTLVTKAERPEEASTWWAQGGIAVTRDDPEQFAADIHDAAAGTADPDAVDTLVDEADDAVRDILVETLGIEFDTNGDGYDYGQEAAHDEPRILHVDAATGRHVHVPFLNYVADETDVMIHEDTAALKLIRHEGRVYGAMLEHDGEWAPTFAGTTVLATGGIGALYPRSTNPADATGDGIAMAALAGADVADMEYVQFHPTAYDGDGEETFLISEAVRGEGAILRNGDGERFMPDYHADAELAPRDVVARAVKTEREETGEVVLDVSDIDFESEFPDLAEKCAANGVVLPEIPVAPAEHFLCGGIDVDDQGQTTLDRLYAVGECARTGVHGANRLASTSLLEGLVWGRRAGAAATGYEPQEIEAPELLDRDPALPDNFAHEKFHRLRRVMDEQVGIERTTDGLQRAQAVLRRLKGEVDAYARTRTSRSLYELRSASVVSLLIARAAAENTESVGCHYLVEEGDAPAADAD
ncbi:L-aspartate oxidase [Salinibaculum rarum]|uniref:L-aspartate oxidase n=1 Tax=Salinibaculum rarum TaxID=3058903 RepID=UPI00265DE790|nr:FAD-dependent oxidoreductase [Salinibaculum sp. KK48]